eukprot:7869488-Alexandrium_andersonii.AAC.1
MKQKRNGAGKHTKLGMAQNRNMDGAQNEATTTQTNCNGAVTQGEPRHGTKRKLGWCATHVWGDTEAP